MKIDLIFSLKTYFNAFNVSLLHVTPPFRELEGLDGGLRHFLDPAFDWQDIGRRILERVQPDTLFLVEDLLGAKYALFEVPEEEDSAYLIGPWRSSCCDSGRTQRADLGLAEQGAALVENYYNTIPQVSDHIIYSITSALISQMYVQEEFKLVHLHESRPLHVETDLRYLTEPDFLVERSAALLEQRCAAENACMDAVTNGDSGGALAAYRQYCSFDAVSSTKRSLRQLKNELISLNTLLRKAIERANVHPYYIDAISTKYLTRLETVTGESDRDRLTHDMLLDYCAYVRRYSLRQYSPLIQKVINYVNLHLDSPLSLKKLAEIYFISPSYLSSLFRQETGSTLTDYINAQRVHRAAQQLVATNSNISMIAAGVGMLDVNYFSKIFKKVRGVTPTQYRRENQKLN